jgi:tRNA(adenine34) deaminase
MNHALQLAERARSQGEVPIGAVVVRGGELLGEGWNQTELLADPSAHAEMQALRRAAALAANYRLPKSVLVTTLEPCLMCFGAILEARVSQLVVGAMDSQRGALRLWEAGLLERYPAADFAWHEGVEAVACRDLLKRYFRDKRG